MKRTTEISNKNMVLTELQRAFDKKFSATEVLDSKLQNILTFLSVIVSVVPAIEAGAFQSRIGVTFWVIMCLVMVLYVLTIDTIIKGISPRTYQMPISNNWDELQARYFHEPEEGVLDLLISEHLTSLQIVGEENGKKANCLEKSSTFMIFIVILLLIAVPLGIFFP